MRIALSAAALLLAAPAAQADPIPVTPANFARAETDSYFASVVQRGGLGRFVHRRDLTSVEDQKVIRPNRDTLYSSALFDLDAGPVTVHLPDAGSRFRSLMVMDEDHHILRVAYTAGTYHIDRALVGTRYAMVSLRTLVDPQQPGDLEGAHRLQDATTIEQPGGPGHFAVPDWDTASRLKVKSALVALGETLPNLDRAFGKAGEIDPVEHLIGTAAAWGGNPRADATYLNVTPERNDGATVYRLKVGKVPVDGFWSITVYNHEGQLAPNPQGAYSINNLSAVPAPGGGTVVQFGGCDASVANCLPIVAGWNYMVRLYRPRPEILKGQWTFPAARPLSE